VSEEGWDLLLWGFNVLGLLSEVFGFGGLGKQILLILALRFALRCGITATKLKVIVLVPSQAFLFD